MVYAVQEVPFWAPFDAVFDTSCPGNERCGAELPLLEPLFIPKVLGPYGVIVLSPIILTTPMICHRNYYP
jgi:hypothetical protein